MSRYPLALPAVGMVTGVGLDAASSCAAIRAALDNFQETRFMDRAGEWIQGCEVPLEQPWRGVRKLAKMLARALSECAREGGIALEEVPILIGLAERGRPGRVAQLGDRVFFATQEELGIRFHARTAVIEQGRVAALVGLSQARRLLYQDRVPAVIVAAVDSLLNAAALQRYEAQERILTSQNANGFIPGEAASAVLVTRPSTAGAPQLCCLGLGFAREAATVDTDAPLRADGLSAAINACLDDAGVGMTALDFSIASGSGEHYGFKEASLALLRTLHQPKDAFDRWQPADCIGEVGAAIGPAALIVLKKSCERGCSAGNTMLCHLSNDDSRRAAGILAYG